MNGKLISFCLVCIVAAALYVFKDDISSFFNKVKSIEQTQGAKENYNVEDN